MATNGTRSLQGLQSNLPLQTLGSVESNRGRGRGRGGQSRGIANGQYHSLPNDRGQDRQTYSGDRAAGSGSRAGRGGRGRRGGGHTRGLSQPQAVGSNDLVAEKPPPQPGGAASLGGLAKDAANGSTGNGGEVIGDGTARGTGTEAEGEEEGDGEVCFICGNTQEHQSVTPCNHRYCTICSLRMRALYKTKACAYCRTELPMVIFTDDAEKKYEEFDQAGLFRVDKNMGIGYENEDVFQDTIVLLRYNCPDPSCDAACMGWPDLHRHVRSVHHKQMCDLCTRNKKVFTHEQDLFTKEELRKHEKQGDDNPGAINQSGFTGHPECGFCRRRFYGEDELYVHCRDNHERCHLCDRRTGGQTPQYYLDYNALEQHFSKDHFQCLEPDCLEKKFVVFDSVMDLKAHQLESHPNSMSKDVRRDARRVDISGFDYRPQYQEVRRGGAARRGGGRGRDPNTDVMPAVSDNRMSRAELAHQREREVHGAQSATVRTFGGQLTQGGAEAQQAPRPAQTQSPRPGNVLPANVAAQERSSVPSSPRLEALNPQEQARRLRHNAVTERAANLLGNDKLKLDEFRERISSYRNGTITASDLIDAFFSLFDTSAAELGKLIKEVADIFEVTGKRDALLEAWNDWKAINEDYPSLPGPAGPASGAAKLGGARVLKLKSSTAPSSRSAMGQQRSWGAAASSSSNNAFPTLAAANSRAPPAPTPGWLTLKPQATATSGSSASSARASPAPSRSQSSANLNKGNAFPALPAAKKPTSTVFTPGYTGAGVLRPNLAASVNAWSGSGAGSGSYTGTSAAPEEGDAAKGKGKKGKNIVFKWG